MLRQMIILSAISFSFICADEESIPDWYLNPPKEDGRLFGTGKGNLRMKAILLALHDLEQNYLVSIGSDTTTEYTNSIIEGGLLGDRTKTFIYRGMDRSIFEENGAGYTKSFESVIHLQFSSLDMTSKIEYYLNEQTESDGKQEFSDLTEHFEAFYLEIDEIKLIEKLEGYGFRFKYAKDEDENYYVLISVDK